MDLQQRASKKEMYFFHNTLTGLLKALERKHTVIDLRNESCVSGFIKSVDGFMNVDMENVVFFDSQGNQRCFGNFFVHARNIRYVHIPKGFSSVELLEDYYDNTNKKAPKSKKKSYKQLRAERYNKEIRESVQSTNN